MPDKLVLTEIAMKKMSKGGMSSDLHAGLTNKSPKAPSEKPKGASVDSDACRESTATSQATLGPRTA